MDVFRKGDGTPDLIFFFVLFSDGEGNGRVTAGDFNAMARRIVAVAKPRDQNRGQQRAQPTTCCFLIVARVARRRGGQCAVAASVAERIESAPFDAWNAG